MGQAAYPYVSGGTEAYPRSVSSTRQSTARTAPADIPAIAGGVPVRPGRAPLIFGAPVIGEAEIASVTECLRSGWIGRGNRVSRFEQEFARYKGAPHAAAVSSGTAAIHLSLVALGVGPGDEVIAPTMTFCSTIHSILHAGARPVLVDCEPTTFNMDPADVKKRITAHTKAILVVHMCGRCCDMDAILDIARRRRLRVIEDCAHAIESRYHGSPAGLMGDAGCFSFYATKNITTGDGGMVITRSKRLCERVRLLSLHGMSADAWTRMTHGANEYHVRERGFKYNMTDMAAALGSPQLAQVEDRWKRREQVWRALDAGLKDLPLRLPIPVERGTRHAYHLYTPLLILESLRIDRSQVLAALRAENILAGIHYVPVHVQPYFRKLLNHTPADFPQAAFVGIRTISLPLSPGMSAEDVSDVCTALARILRHFAAAPGSHRRGRSRQRVEGIVKREPKK